MLTTTMTRIPVRGSPPITLINAAENWISDVIQGMQMEWREDLGHTGMRDPDALPPKNAFEWIMNALYRTGLELVQGNSLYAIKAGLLTS
jgi:hypothetical protein